MNFRQLFPTAALVWMLFSLFAQTPASAIGFEYDWLGGQPGYIGKIFLNAPSSALALDGGRDADVLPGSFVSTPLGTFSILDYGLDSAFGLGGLMIWNTTSIQNMDLFFDPVSPIINPAYGLPAIGLGHAGNDSLWYQDSLEVGSLVGGFGTVFSEDDFTGHWMAVPEPSIFSFIAIGLGLALSIRWRFRTHMAIS